MQKKLEDLKLKFDQELCSVDSLESLAKVRATYIGRSGFLKLFFADASGQKELLQLVNKVAQHISSALQKKQAIIKNAILQQKLEAQKLDVTYPARQESVGTEHIISKTIEEAINIFAAMGFFHVQGPEIETEHNVFDALNTPKHHPARQMQDSFYLEDGNMLRTHTSSVQIRFMQDAKPPFRICSAGRVYRNDWDATHTPMFHQIEALCVDDNINMSHMKSCIEIFLKEFFGEVNFRMRPSYFPFTEPSAEVDIQKKDFDWLEILGCGMVHPNVLQNVGIDSKKYTGFALGMGIERIAMLKYGISDLRNFFSCDLRWKVI